MDPISILGIVGSVVSVADIVSKSIRKLSDLRSRYNNVSHGVATLIGQLFIVKAALDELSAWTSRAPSYSPRYRQLASQIDMSLDCFAPLILSLQQRLDDFDVSEHTKMTSKQKLLFLWDEQEMNSYLSLIDRQVNALTLFLQAIQCGSWSEQQRMMTDTDNQSILQQAKECSSSIIMITDSFSIHSEYSGFSKHSKFSENSNAISAEFEFDALVVGSRAYVAAHRSHLRQAIKYGRIQKGNTSGTTSNAPSVMNQDVTISKVTSSTSDQPPSYNDTERKQQHEKKSDKMLTGKVLLLGISECGKTTLTRAMQLYCGIVDDIETRRDFSPTILDNIVTGTRSVLAAMVEFNIRFHRDVNYTHMQELPKDIFELNGKFPEKTVAAILSIWDDPGFVRAYKCRYESSLPECAHEFVKEIYRLTADDYVPSSEDILKMRVKSLGVNQTKLVSSNTILDLWDTGGERSERKKWIQCFPGVSTLLFVVDVTACGRHRLVEAEANRMLEQLLVFETLVNGKWFHQSHVLIVFTKIDLLDDILQLEQTTDDWEESLKPLAPSPQLYDRQKRMDTFLERLELRCRSLIKDTKMRDRLKFARVGSVPTVNAKYPSVFNTVAEVVEMLEDLQREPVVSG